MNGISYVQARAALDQQMDYVRAAGIRSLVQRSRVCVESLRIVAVRVFARIEQQSHDICSPVLSREGEGDMPGLGVGSR